MEIQGFAAAGPQEKKICISENFVYGEADQGGEIQEEAQKGILQNSRQTGLLFDKLPISQDFTCADGRGFCVFQDSQKEEVMKDKGRNGEGHDHNSYPVNGYVQPHENVDFPAHGEPVASSGLMKIS